MKHRIAKKTLHNLERSLSSKLQELFSLTADPTNIVREECSRSLSLGVAILLLEHLRLDPSSPYRKRWSDGVGWLSLSLMKPYGIAEYGEFWWGPTSDIAAGMIPEPLQARLRLFPSDKGRKISYWIKIGSGSDYYCISNLTKQSTQPSIDLEVNSKDEFGETLLMRAASNDNLTRVISLVDKGADVNIATQTGFTALMLATMFGHETIVQVLLEHEANPNVQTEDSTTALMLASRFGYVNIVNSLLNKGSEVNARNRWGETPLTLARSRGYIEFRPYNEIVELLINAGAENF